MIDNLASPLCFAGNKTRILPLIHQHLPEDYDLFVDVFGGSGVVGLSQDKKLVYNEKDKYVFNLNRTIKETDLDHILFQIQFLIDTYNLSKDNKQSYLKFREDFNSLFCHCLHDRNLITRRQSNLALLTLVFYSFNHYITFNKDGKFTTPAGTHRSSYNKSIKNKLVQLKERIDSFGYNLEMCNMDFRDIYEYVARLYDYHLEGKLFFFDPPYMLSDSQYNRTHGNAWTKDNEIQLYKLCDLIHKNGGKFIVTNLVESKGETNEHLLTFSKKYSTINTNCDFSGCNYQRGNKKTDKEILVKNY